MLLFSITFQWEKLWFKSYKISILRVINISWRACLFFLCFIFYLLMFWVWNFGYLVFCGNYKMLLLTDCAVCLDRLCSVPWPAVRCARPMFEESHKSSNTWMRKTFCTKIIDLRVKPLSVREESVTFFKFCFNSVNFTVWPAIYTNILKYNHNPCFTR